MYSTVISGQKQQKAAMTTNAAFLKDFYKEESLIQRINSVAAEEKT